MVTQHRVYRWQKIQVIFLFVGSKVQFLNFMHDKSFLKFLVFRYLIKNDVEGGVLVV